MVAKLHQHPEIIARTDGLLCSINDRLGSVCVALNAERTGQDFDQLGWEWADDVMAILSQEAEERSEYEAELNADRY